MLQETLEFCQFFELLPQKVGWCSKTDFCVSRQTFWTTLLNFFQILDPFEVLSQTVSKLISACPEEHFEQFLLKYSKIKENSLQLTLLKSAVVVKTASNFSEKNCGKKNRLRNQPVQIFGQ